MTEMTDTERAIVERFEAGEAAPESWRAADAEEDLVVHLESVSIAKAHAMAAHLQGRPVGDGDGQEGLRSAIIDLLESRENELAAADADVLLPVVTAWAEQRARERAAEELRTAAAEVECRCPVDPADDSSRLCPRHSTPTVGDLLERADALAADDRTGQPPRPAWVPPSDIDPAIT